MPSRQAAQADPRDESYAGEAALRGGEWSGPPREFAPPVRCRGEEWYLARTRVPDSPAPEVVTLQIVFRGRRGLLGQRRLRLHSVHGRGGSREYLGWIETPPGATRLQIGLAEGFGDLLREINLHRVAERDPKCHPLANLPRWGTYRPPLTIRRLVLSAALRELAARLPELPSDIRKRPPASFAELVRLARGNALVLDPAWARALRLGIRELEALARAAWVVVDLETFARCVTSAGLLEAELVTHRAVNGIMSARCEYADVPTRGLALQDVVPYSSIDEGGRFCTRGIRASRVWMRYADATGLATLLSSETPRADRHGDVLSAARAIEAGELLVTDLPWLASGAFGPLLAPRVTTHLLRMHLAAPLADHLQYWNRWSDGNVVVRDIADLAGRYGPLRTARWATAETGVARLGLMLPAAGQARRHVLVSTGRIDDLADHDGLPPEPLMILMRNLAREAREQTDWARSHLADVTLTWQFDAADGVRYAVLYDAAPPDGPPPEVHRLRLGGSTATRRTASGMTEHLLSDDEGVHGDGSLAMLDALHRLLRRAIEKPG